MAQKIKKKTKFKTSNLYPYKKIIAIYLCPIVVLIISIFYLLSSNASVLITFEPEKISSDFIIKLGSKTDLKEETVKSEILEEIKEKEETVLPSQAKTIETKASGEIIIINNYNQNQTLVATTRLLSPEGLLFRTTYNVVAPSGGRVKVKVVADQLGKQYEIGPTKFTIPGLWPGLQDKIYGQSDQPMSRTIKKVGIFTQEEIEQYKKEIKEEIAKETLENRKIKPEIIKIETLEELINAESGEEKENLKIKLKMKIITVAFNENDLEDIIKTNFKKIIPQEKELLSINKEKLIYSLVNYNLEEKTGKMKVSVEGNFVPNLQNLNFPKDKLVGLSESEVKEYFSNFPTIENVEVKLNPFWLKTMPLLSDKIEIKIMK